MIFMSQDKFNEMYKTASQQVILGDGSTQVNRNYDVINVANTARRLELEVKTLQADGKNNPINIANIRNRTSTVEEYIVSIENSVLSLSDEQALMADQISSIATRLNALEKENKMLKEAHARDVKKHAEYAKKINSLEAHKKSMEDRIASLEVQLAAKTAWPQGPTIVGEKFGDQEDIKKLCGAENLPSLSVETVRG